MYSSIKLNYILTSITCDSGGTSSTLPELIEVPDTIIGDASSNGYSYEKDIDRVGGFDTEPVDVEFLKWLEKINPKIK